jgi:ActR/RegA family two-component response regulator
MQDTMAMNRLLLVEDDPVLRERMKWALGEHFQVVEADSVESTLARLEPGGSPVVCLDLGLEGRPEKGLDIIDAVLASDRGAKIVVITSDTDPATAKEAIRRGAFDLLSKPLDLDMLRNALERAKRIHDL